MLSFVTALVLTLILLWRRPIALVQWPIIILIIYCLAGSSTIWFTSLINSDTNNLILSLINEKSAEKVDLIMSSAGLAIGLGLLWGSNTPPILQSDQVRLQSTDDRVIQRSILLSVPLCVVILLAYMNSLSAGSAEQVRLTLLQSGYWPFIVALFGWFLPVLIVGYAARSNGLVATAGPLKPVLGTIVITAITLSVLIGFRTYAALSILIGITFFALNRRLSSISMILSAAIVIGSFLLVTIVRVQEGVATEADEVAYSVFRRLSFEPIGAAELVFSLVERNGYYLGQTLLMDLHSKMPGRQETFAGQLGHEAGFAEGLTLTPSGPIEVYANFSFYGIPLLFAIAYIAGRCLTNTNQNISSNLATRLFAFLFLIDFIMGGSSAVFDLLVRLFLFRFALKVKIFS